MAPSPPRVSSTTRGPSSRTARAASTGSTPGCSHARSSALTFATCGGRQHARDAVAVADLVVDGRRPAVGVDEHQRAVGDALTSASSAPAIGSSTRPSVPTCRIATSAGISAERQLGRDVRRRRAALVEAVARVAGGVELGQRERRRAVGAQRPGRATRRPRRASRRARAPKRSVETRPEEADAPPEAPERARRVERAAAGVGGELLAVARDEVEQRLSRDEDHASPRNSISARCVSRGRSSWGTWPQFSSRWRAPGAVSLTWRAKAMGTRRS